MRTPVANQISKRRAVSDALGRHKVFVSSRLFRGDGQTISRVLVSGQYYDVSDALLDRLMAGATPRELELEPAPEDAAH
ncbi:hypothetical protein [Aminobacter aminovorans]|jgi:hypothetical protein|uniref:Uncharacterized protein n=1 Tax=Aminobacter aminovorans TaxID=83263 RepID=A0AAC8YQ86_AMIAI|nr:hypothetical protein [Aminobacter aminovorans]AMS42507.1 hypothetical protein AA2016_3585 [Aminobacter aminovorans]MBB3707769.1 hypothetical protein [Aminobacter aminovorans]